MLYKQVATMCAHKSTSNTSGTVIKKLHGQRTIESRKKVLRNGKVILLV